MYSGVSTLGLAQHPSADSTQLSLQTVYNNVTQLHLSCCETQIGMTSTEGHHCVQPSYGRKRTRQTSEEVGQIVLLWTKEAF